jgi:hypothetical protein
MRQIMAKEYLTLSAQERLEFILEAARALNREAAVLEKDIWVCWALEALFSLELPMVFKGGTSLSKVYRVINRFSEDLDITIDHAASGDVLTDPIAASVSNSKRREFSERMKHYTQQTVRDQIMPHLQHHADQVGHVTVSLAGEGDEIQIHYQQVVQSRYILPYLKLEFGSRNAIEPSAVHLIQPDVLAWDSASQLKFPCANVPVLLAERTFWEKVTLIHAELTRKNPKITFERYSRHWYDLAQLAGHEVGSRALKRLDLRDHVIRTKTALFGISGVNYDQVATGQCQLVPTDHLQAALEHDYTAMNKAGMFEGAAPTWSKILLTLQELEHNINKLG